MLLFRIPSHELLTLNSQFSHIPTVFSDLYLLSIHHSISLMVAIITFKVATVLNEGLRVLHIGSMSQAFN